MLTVGRDDQAADLDGWVTLTNGSGTAFRDAKLQFVAGDLNRVQRAARREMMDMVAEAKSLPASMVQESFSEYHLYTLGRRTTIANQETKQLALLNSTGVPVEKRYIVDGQSFLFATATGTAPARRSRTTSRCPTASATMHERSGPRRAQYMPAGVIRVYRR